jgi:hypothetical protein
MYARVSVPLLGSFLHDNQNWVRSGISYSLSNAVLCRSGVIG